MQGIVVFDLEPSTEVTYCTHRAWDLQKETGSTVTVTVTVNTPGRDDKNPALIAHCHSNMRCRDVAIIKQEGLKIDVIKKIKILKPVSRQHEEDAA